MATAALFGSSSGLGGSSGGNKHLVEFRAGRMTLKGRMVHPDKRKGLLYVYQGEDSLMHFCWKDRTTGEVEDDLLIFPDDCEFVRVNECTTGRVYVLKFKSFSKKYFFWLQEPKTDKDDEYCRRINETLNNPPTSGGRSGGGGGAQDGELQNLLNNMSQQQLMQLFGGVGQIGGLSSLLGTMGNTGSSGTASSRTSGALGRGSSAGRGGDSRASSRGRDTPTAPPTATAAAQPAATAAATTEAAPPSTTTTTSQSGQSRASGQIFLSDLQRYFSGLGTAPPGMSGEAAESGAAGATGAADVALSAALSGPGAVAAATQPQHESRLTPHLPGDPPQDDVRTTLLSPQFAQAANLFSTGLTSGQMAPVISQFGLGAEATAAATTGNMEAFLKAIENNAAADDQVAAAKNDKPKDEKKDDGDDGMSVD